MQPISKSWIALLAIVILGAGIHLALPTRRLLPNTDMLLSFPTRLRSYVAQDAEFSNSEVTRRAYAPASIVYRSYADGANTPIDLLIAPEPVGSESPSICASYGGSVVLRKSVVPLEGGHFSEIVYNTDANSKGEVSICAYYWRTSAGSIDEQSFALLKERLAIALLRGREASFRVEACTRAKDAKQALEASERLKDFITLVDPELQHLMRNTGSTRN